jgi:hypothetical protein
MELVYYKIHLHDTGTNLYNPIRPQTSPSSPQHHESDNGFLIHLNTKIVGKKKDLPHQQRRDYRN